MMLAAAEPSPRRHAQAVYVIDDDRHTRTLLMKVLTRLGWDVEAYDSAESFLAVPGIRTNGCLLVDVKLSGMNGIDFLRTRPPALKRMPAIVLTGFGDVRLVVKAMRAGAEDFLEKPIILDHLREAVSRAFLSARQKSANTHDPEAAKLISSLTVRQLEILHLIVDGATNKEIAARLGISQRTVEAHRASIMQRVGANTFSDLLRIVLSSRPPSDSMD